VAWQAEVPGYGQSSPVIWKGHVFVTSVQGPMRQKCHVSAFALRTGQRRWTRTVASSLPVEMSYYVSRAAPTPCVDGQGVYAFFESGDLLGLGHDGRILWQRALVKEFGAFQNEFGIGPSLAQNRQALFVLIDDPGGAYLLAVDKRTGRTLWRKEREPRKSWTSPVLARYRGAEVLIVSSNGFVESFDPADGTRQWVVEGITGNLIASATVESERVFVGATSAQARLARPGGRSVAESNCCLRLFGEPGRPQAEVAWLGQRATCDFASPLVYRGLVYTVTAAGVATAVDAGSGQTVFSERIDSPCWASPLGAEGRVYFLGKNGVTTVLKAGPVFEKLASNALWDPEHPPRTSEPFATTPRSGGGPPPGGAAALDPILYGIAAVDGSLVLRLGSHLFCLR
jgi:outer membrane protein assembly factor BamB